MKALLLIALISFSFCYSEWKKRSFRENHLGIELAVKQAFKEYSQSNPDADIDSFERLTVYSTEGKNIIYKMTFFDINGETNKILVYYIASPLSVGSKEEYSVNLKGTLKASVANNLPTSVVDYIHHTLEEYLKNEIIKDTEIYSVDDGSSVFYFVSTQKGKKANYLIVQDKNDDTFELHVL